MATAQEKETTSLIDALKQQGNEAFARKDYHEAIRLFTLAIDSDVEQPVLWSNRSAARCALQEYAAALADAEEAIRLDPKWAKGYGRKGAALFGMRRIKEATESYQQGLALDPQNTQLKQGLEQCQQKTPSPTPGSGVNPFAAPNLIARLASNPRTQSFLSQPDFMAKLKELQESNGRETLIKHLGDQRIMTALGVLIGVDMEEPANRKEEPTTKREEDKPTTKREEEIQKNKDGRQKVAEETFEASEERSKAKELKEQGNSAYKQRNFEEALNLYKLAQSEAPSDPTLILNEAAVHFEAANWDACIEACERAVELGRETRATFQLLAKAFSRAGLAAKRKGDLEAAIKYYRKSLTEHRSAETLEKLKEAERELETQKRLAMQDPALAERERNSGNELFKKGEFAEAVKHYTEAIARDDRDPRALSNRAACYTKLGAIPEAIKDAERAISLDPIFVKAYLRKANAEFLKKDIEACMKTCQQALEVDKDGANKAEIEALQMKCLLAGRGAEDSNLTPEERVQRDPELQKILSDPAMRIILQQMQTDPKAAQEHMKNPLVASKIRKLIAAGILRTA